MSFEQERSGYESTNAPRTFDSSAGNDFRGNPGTGGTTLNDDTSRRLDAALHAPFGIDKLLNRLKQSIYSTREFSGFLRERCALEDRHAQGYKKLVRNTGESLRRAEARQGSYARNFGETLQLNERLAENGLTFASALHTMSEELRDVADNAERGRKQWKHTFIDAEKRLAEAEAAQQKAKDRYNNAAEQYDRARTGERQGGMFGLKNKNPAQQEEALKEKADMLDKEYAERFEAAQTRRLEFEGTTRRQIVQALREIIDECDAAVAMQMAKLASVSEKHIVSNGTAIAPIKAPGSDIEPRGLRNIARDIDDRRDFTDYMLDGVEPPPQFKGRSRRNTDVDLVHPSPAQRTDTTETPYNPSQSHVESRPPQLPQIGGSDSFSRSFEADRPAPQNNRSSYLGGQADALNSHPTHHSQQTGVTNDLAPSLSTNRAPIGPSLPSYDRGQASPTDDFSGNNGYGRGQGTARQDTIPGVAGIGRPSMDNQPYDRAHGPTRQDTMPVSGGRGQTAAGDPYADRNQGGLRQDTTPSFAGRGQTTGPAPFLDRGQAAPGEEAMPGAFPASRATTRQDNLPTLAGQGRMSMDAPSYSRDQGSGRTDNVPYSGGRGQYGAATPLADRTQGPLRQDTKPFTGPGEQLLLGRENPYIGNNQDPTPPANGREQVPLGRENPYIANKQDPIATTSGRDQPPVGRENPYIGNTQDLNDGVRGQLPVGRENPYMNDSQDTNRALVQGSAGAPYPTSGSPTEGSGYGRGQVAQGIGSAGRGGPGAGRALLPSQQQQQQQIQQPQHPMLPPTRPVFGMHLDDLFRRDGSAVPTIVFQCIQAIDMFGLSSRGIYRVSGSSHTVQQLKSEFDHGKLKCSNFCPCMLTVIDSGNVDLTNREAFNNDIAAVATLLKNFLRDLKDPLLTASAYHSFIQAAQFENSIMRRDSMHQYINSLPDPNYATLRVLTLHLHRVSMNNDVNQMNMVNLATVFGPTVMGSRDLADTKWQTKVMETILHHTHDIFDPDE